MQPRRRLLTQNDKIGRGCREEHGIFHITGGRPKGRTVGELSGDSGTAGREKKKEEMPVGEKIGRMLGKGDASREDFKGGRGDRASPKI